MERYYLTQRPPSPGAFPGKPANMEAYDQRTYVEELEGYPGEYVDYCSAPGNEHTINVDFRESEII